MTIRTILTIAVVAGILNSCQQKENKVVETAEDTDAKSMLQGVWIDSDTQEVNFKAKGDTIYYADSLYQPAYFKIVGDSLIMGENRQRYEIVKQTANLLWFKNSNSDLVKLQKSDNPEDAHIFESQKPKVIAFTEVVKRDTVVTYNNQRYHCYVAINPTRYKVRRTAFNEVDNVYYDNIVHVSVYKGNECLYSRDMRKSLFDGKMPAQFLSQAILSDVEFCKVDSDGFHFETTVCIPDGASCYMFDLTVGFTGKVRIRLLEY